MKKEIKKLEDFRKWLDKYIVKNFGKKCSSFAWDCPVCRAHLVKEMFDDFVEDLIETEEWFEKQKKLKITKNKIKPKGQCLQGLALQTL